MRELGIFSLKNQGGVFFFQGAGEKNPQFFSILIFNEMIMGCSHGKLIFGIRGEKNNPLPPKLFAKGFFKQPPRFI